ncbi:methyltransferase domain-containing protein [Methylobacterium longum]|uniref:Methyltransferase domain-containing protein n=1 Tax=Methylobacterium longum TaxID=767694 RepID=A0ABT8AZZ8_9HYPH|nr:methyltransferase domain-containing protein [Methylobacterium longum]MDN3574844.1 methyltransferase domain-containing protein [Methylobacterium longum]GJE13884.1 23S rRNA (uracil(1939)-C(5))-methyltransferase RlmD [Methylobacterium longum]
MRRLSLADETATTRSDQSGRLTDSWHAVVEAVSGRYSELLFALKASEQAVAARLDDLTESVRGASEGAQGGRDDVAEAVDRRVEDLATLLRDHGAAILQAQSQVRDSLADAIAGRFGDLAYLLREHEALVSRQQSEVREGFAEALSSRFNDLAYLLREQDAAFRERQNAARADLQDLASRIDRIVPLIQDGHAVAESRAASARFQAASYRAALGRVKVVFIAQTAETWPSFHSVVEAFRHDPRCETTVVVSPFLQGGYPSARLRDFLVQRDIPFTTAEAYDLEAEAPDVLFYQNPYDSTRPASLHVGSVERVVPRIAYIPYGLEIGGGDENRRYQFDLNVQQRCWRIFARSERHRRMFGRYCRAGDNHVVVSGHPKFDWAQGFTADDLDPSLVRAVDGRKAFLWNPHFAISSESQWSMFFIWKDVLVDLFASREDIVLLLRPHPSLFTTILQHGVMTQAEIDAFLQGARDRGALILDERPDYRHSFTASVALMSDVSSFLLEYLPTTKPILYLRNEAGPGLNDDAEIINAYALGDSDHAIRRFIDDVSAGRDPCRSARLGPLSEYLFGTDGLAGQRIKDHVVAAVLHEGARWPRSRARDEAPGSPDLGRGLSTGPGLTRPVDPSAAQSAASAFWMACNNTFLASPEYYMRQEAILQAHVLPLIETTWSILDIGCGNGRFTLLMAACANSVRGFDLSRKLVDQARAEAARRGIANARFDQRDLSEYRDEDVYEMVSCMGVVSTLIEDERFDALLGILRGAVRQQGLLVLKDTVAVGANDVFVSTAEYTSLYRAEAKYLGALAACGFDAIEAIEMGRDQGLVNKMFIFRRA